MPSLESGNRLWTFGGATLLYALSTWIYRHDARHLALFAALAFVYCLVTHIALRRNLRLFNWHWDHIFLTLDVWGPVSIWALTGFHESAFVLLFPALVAQHAIYGVGRVLWTMHAMAAAQLLTLRLLHGGSEGYIEVGAVYFVNIGLLVTAAALSRGREHTEQALLIARDALQNANDQAAELAQARSKAESASAAKSEFLAHISHELRTPLNAVIGMAELMSHSRLSIDQRDQLATLRSSADTLLALIEDVLDYSKIEANQLELERRPFSLRQCLEVSIDLVAVRAAQKDLDLAYFIDTDVPETLIGDSLRLRQVLTNLMMNAVKFTEVGGVGVLVSSETGNDGTPLLHVFVNDTGIGIPEDKVERLFKAFSQVDSSTTRHYGGTGLGLVICKRLVQRMGGDIWVETSEGEGSTFHFTIKLDAAPGAKATEGTWLAGKTVLVVDDGIDVSHLLSKHVRSWGGTPLLASSLLELAEWLGLGLRADLALVDLQMPEATGVLDALKKAAIPHIAMSWRGQTRLTERGEVGIAWKPVKHDPLAEAVRTALFEKPSPSAPSSDEAVPTMMGGGVRVLIADDNVVNQKVGLGMLKRLGLEAHAANNGLEAVEMTRKHGYDLVLMDVFMPVMDGLVATQHIVKERGDKLSPRVVAMTANALETDRERCLAAGMDDFLTKPLRIDALETTVRRILDLEPRVNAPPVEPPAPVMATHTASAKLDERTIANLRELDQAAGGGVFDEVVGAYLTDTRLRLTELRSALDAQQVALAERLAHTIKGSSGYLGAALIAAHAAELESLVQRGEFVAARKVLTQLERAWEDLTPQLEALRTSTDKPVETRELPTS